MTLFIGSPLQNAVQQPFGMDIERLRYHHEVRHQDGAPTGLDVLRLVLPDSAVLVHTVNRQQNRGHDAAPRTGSWSR